MKNYAFLAIIFCSLTVSLSSFAEQNSNLWQLSTEQSKIAYASIKKDTVGELNHFNKFSGGISAAGQVDIDIDLNSVETYIDIRNQRMQQYIFGSNGARAKLQTKVDINTLNALPVGDTSTLDINGTLDFLGKKIELETTFFVARLSKTKLLASTDSMMMIKTDTLGVDEGVDQLMALAKLSGITRVIPITLRLVFNTEAAVASHAKKINSVAQVDDPFKAGKKVYRQCQACHNVKSENNGVGPHLVNILGRKAGTVDKYTYSTALKNSGITWTRDQLAAFITNPQALIPDNGMPFAGLSNPEDVDNLLLFLESL